MIHKKRNFSSYDKNTVFFQSKVLEIINQNQECANGAIRNYFKVQHPTKNEPLTCVLWERSCMNTGDKIDLKGVFKDGIFVAYSAMVYRNGNISNNA